MQNVFFKKKKQSEFNKTENVFSCALLKRIGFTFLPVAEKVSGNFSVNRKIFGVILWEPEYEYEFIHKSTILSCAVMQQVVLGA